MISVVIPVYNEATVLGETLDTLLQGAAESELEVIVVCNGCDDESVELARRFEPRVRVIETPVASKARALNLGDEAACSFPRFFIDADVRVNVEDLRQVARVLDLPGVFAAAPRLEVDFEQCSWAVRAYYQIWMRLAYVRENMIGSGVYALSEEGRRRFERFPDLIADDLFVHDLFAPGERRCVPEASFRVRPARNVRDLIARKTRVFVGNAQLAAAQRLRTPKAPGGEWIDALRGAPSLIVYAPVYAWVNGIAKLRARSRLRRADFGDWGRDASSRRRSQREQR